jgi:hypothetical protein
MCDTSDAMKTIASVLLMSAVACGGNKAPESWTTRPVKTVAGTVAGIKFSIDLPEGMRQKDEKDEAVWDFLVKIGDEEYAKTPEIRIKSGTYADKTLEEAMKSPMRTDVSNWVRKDALPDGYILAYENGAYKGKEDYIIERYIAGEPSLECSIRVTPWTRGATVKDKLPQAEKICESLKLVK